MIKQLIGTSSEGWCFVSGVHQWLIGGLFLWDPQCLVYEFLWLINDLLAVYGSWFSNYLGMLDARFADGWCVDDGHLWITRDYSSVYSWLANGSTVYGPFARGQLIVYQWFMRGF